MEYVIVYTNGKTVQGHRVNCLVSRVNIFIQKKVQRVAPTSPMEVSTDESIGIFGHECHSCGELLVSGVNDIHCK